MMEVKICYDQCQLDKAVDFIAKNNSNFFGQDDYIRNCMLDHMREMARDPERWMQSTMGYCLVGDREFENVDCDENSIRFEIWVDPVLGVLDEFNWKEEIISSTE
jgi:hypothetical protein